MKKKFFNHCFFVIFSLFIALPTLTAINNQALAAPIGSSCASNTDCDSGLVCATALNGNGKTCQNLTVTDAASTVSNQNAFVATICNVLKIVTGNGGKAFAAFAIISLGIGFFTGKVSWGLMIGIAAGIAAMFGAPTIVAAISGTTAYDCRSTNI